jgi:hypothetical protein
MAGITQVDTTITEVIDIDVVIIMIVDTDIIKDVDIMHV